MKPNISILLIFILVISGCNSTLEATIPIEEKVIYKSTLSIDIDEYFRLYDMPPVHFIRFRNKKITIIASKDIKTSAEKEKFKRLMTAYVSRPNSNRDLKITFTGDPSEWSSELTHALKKERSLPLTLTGSASPSLYRIDDGDDEYNANCVIKIPLQEVLPRQHKSNVDQARVMYTLISGSNNPIDLVESKITYRNGKALPFGNKKIYVTNQLDLDKPDGQKALFNQSPQSNTSSISIELGILSNVRPASARFDQYGKFIKEEKHKTDKTNFWRCEDMISTLSLEERTLLMMTRDRTFTLDGEITFND